MQVTADESVDANVMPQKIQQVHVETYTKADILSISGGYNSSAMVKTEVAKRDSRIRF